MKKKKSEKEQKEKGKDSGAATTGTFASCLLERNSWKKLANLIGHTQPTTVTKFNPRMFRISKGKDAVNAGANEEENPYFSIVAVGSMDSTITLWNTNKSVPLVRLVGFFSETILDINWSSDGLSFAACSHDGTMAYFKFSEKDFGGTVISFDETKNILSNIYGDISSSSNIINEIDNLADNPVLLQMQKQSKEIINKEIFIEPSRKISNSNSNNNPLSPEKVQLLQKETTVKTSKGERKKILPVNLESISRSNSFQGANILNREGSNYNNNSNNINNINNSNNSNNNNNINIISSANQSTAGIGSPSIANSSGASFLKKKKKILPNSVNNSLSIASSSAAKPKGLNNNFAKPVSTWTMGCLHLTLFDFFYFSSIHFSFFF